MIVVSDTSPISSFFLIDQLDLLPSIFGKVIIPQSVFAELLILETKFGYDLTPMRSAAWLDIQQAKDQDEVNRLRNILDDGESEAIILAKELHADYLLIDEHEGREFALSEGLQIIGVLGILLQAKNKELIKKVRPLMDDLQAVAKFRISKRLYQHVSNLAGE